MRQQGGRDLQAGDAALVGGGGEARDVAGDAAAEGDDEAVAVVAGGDEGIEDLRVAGEVFVRLAVRQVYGDDGFVGKGGSKRGEVMCGDVVVGDDADLPLRVRSAARSSWRLSAMSRRSC